MIEINDDREGIASAYIIVKVLVHQVSDVFSRGGGGRALLSAIDDEDGFREDTEQVSGRVVEVRAIHALLHYAGRRVVGDCGLIQSSRL